MIDLIRLRRYIQSLQRCSTTLRTGRFLLLLSSFLHDPGSGLAGIFFEVVERTARNASHYRTKEHLSGQTERLNVGSLAIFRDIQHFERSLMTLCGHYLAILRHEFLTVRHHLQFPTSRLVALLCGNSNGTTTLPGPKLE